MTINLNDLDAKTRRKLLAAGRPVAAPRRRRPAPEAPAAATTPEAPWTWRCHECGLRSTVWAAIERHVNTVHGGGRLVGELGG